jgi:hypothetical protein
VESIDDFLKAGSWEFFAMRADKVNLDAPIAQGHLLCYIATMGEE